jgi:hypothetical protein
VGLSATAQGGVEEIFEDVIAKPDPITMLKFKSEYECATSRSTMNGKLVLCDKDENVVNKIIESIKITYDLKPSICFLEKDQMEQLKTSELAENWKFYDSSQLN